MQFFQTKWRSILFTRNACHSIVRRLTSSRGMFLVAFLCAALPVVAQHFETTAFQQQVQRVVREVSGSCVKISGYDSVRKVTTAGKFSGVVVSADGYILTAAHACSPNRVYKVEFPDGSEYVGVGLGRIASVDAALMKITTTGKWNFSEIGWSHSLKEYQPCLSIAYPASIDAKNQPVVRLGYIGEPLTKSGMVRSTCLMEPGDSGGPLFDLFGRVVGIHSRIELGLDANLEIPVDQFRKYWSALKLPENYRGREMPASEEIGIDLLAKSLETFPELSQLPVQFSGLEEKLENTTVEVKSTMGSTVSGAWGTCVSLKPVAGKKGKGVWIVSKSSLVGAEPYMITKAGKQIKMEVLGRDDSTDLVLLQAAGMKNGVELSPASPDTLTSYEKGGFLLSPSPTGAGRVSVYSAGQLAIAGRSGIGFLGVMSETYEGKLRLSQVVNNSPAELYTLKTGDLLEKVNGLPVSSPLELTNVLSKFKPRDKVEISVLRADSSFTKLIELGIRPEMGTHAADRFEEGKSVRRDGFSRVLVHDGRVRPEECGGPVFDAKGNFQGINIARISRTSSLVIPSSTVYGFVEMVASK